MCLEPINLFALPRPLPPRDAEERLDVLLRTGSVRVERIVSTGQSSPPGFWYDQDEDEWVALLDGEAELSFGDGTGVSLRRGDSIFLPARCRHRLEWTSEEPPCVWLAIFAKNSSQ